MSRRAIASRSCRQRPLAAPGRSESARSADGPVVATENGRPVAVLIGTTYEAEIERLLLARTPRLRAVLDESRRQIQSGAGVVHEEFWSPTPPVKPPRPPRRAK